MISASDLHDFAERVIQASSKPEETDLRRAISALYYGLFHQLVAASTACFARGGPELVARASRAFDHRTLLAVCKIYSKPRTGGMPEPFATLIPAGPNPKLVKVARIFVQLQEARHRADYDLQFTFAQQEALDLLRLARSAHKSFTEVQNESDTSVFLTALLLHERWSRGG